MLLVLLVVSLVTALLLRYLKMRNYWKERGVPHVKPIPIFGNMPQKTLIEVTTEVYNAAPNSRYVGYHMFSTPVLMIRDPELIKQIMIKESDVFAERNAFVPEDIDPIWSNGLFATRAEKWRQLRPKLSPAFTSNKMRMMFTLIEECAQEFVHYFKSQGSDCISVELKEIFSRYTNDVIATSAFGIKCESMKDKSNIFYEMGRDLTNFKGLRSLKLLLLSISPFLMKILKIRILPTKSAEYFQSIIKNTVKEREDRNIIRPDMIHLLLEARKHGFKNEDLTDIDIAAQAMIFFLAGFETVSTALSFLLYELAVNDEIQEKLFSEIDAVHAQTRGKLDYEAVSKMKYMDMVISESMRKWGQTVVVDRKPIKPFTIEPINPDEKPVRLDVENIVLMPMFVIQRDEKYFPNPEKFDPERFNDENKNNIVSGTYFPFGMGPRVCIGSRFAQLEMKTLLFHLLRSFKVEPCQQTPIPLVLDKSSLNLQPKGGFWVQYKRRN